MGESDKQCKIAFQQEKMKWLAEKKAKESGGKVEDFLEEKKEEKAEEPEVEVEEVEMVDPEPVMGEPPKYQLTDDDKRIKFRTTSTPDLAENVFNTFFQNFSVPSKEEGFDAIRYE